MQRADSRDGGAGQGHHQEDREDVGEEDATGQKAAHGSDQGNVLKSKNETGFKDVAEGLHCSKHKASKVG